MKWLNRIIVLMVLMMIITFPILANEEKDDQYFVDMPNGFLNGEEEDITKAISMLEYNPRLRSTVKTRVIPIPFKVTNQKGNYFMWSDLSILSYQGKYAFCIDPLTKIYPQYNYKDVDFNTVLTASQREKVQLILQYGYSYQGHMTDDYYLATQKLIWETLGYTVRYYAKNSNFTGTYSVKKQEDEIKRLVANHQKQPSFDQQVISMKVGETIVLVDEENVVSDYKIQEVSNHLEVTCVGNELSITAKAPNDKGRIVFQKGADRVDDVMILAHKASGSQTMVTMPSGAMEPLMAQIEVQAKGYGTMELLKLDQESNKPLANVTFRIGKDEQFQSEVGVYTTDENGKIFIEDMEPNTYYYQEIATVPPYVLDTTVHSFTIEIGKITELLINNQTQKAQLLIRKLDQDTKEESQAEASLDGAEYDLLASDQVTVVEHIVADGRIAKSSSLLDVDTVYYLKETKAPKGMKRKEELVAVRVPYTQPTVSVVEWEMDFFDEVITNKIQIQKWKYVQVDSPWYQRVLVPAQGVRFDVYEKWSNQKVEQLICDEQGKAESRLLPYGTYILKEVEHPGYQLIEPFEVTINDDQQVYYYERVNEPLQSKIMIQKIDRVTKKPIRCQGIEFQILDHEDQPIQQINENGETVDVFVSDEWGSVELFQPLMVGTYQLKEIKAANGYVLASEPISFIVDGSEEEIQLLFENQPIEGQILLYKYGELFQGYEDAMTPYGLMKRPYYEKGYLKDVVFELYAKEDIVGKDGTIWYHQDELVDSFITKDTGPVSSKCLPLGKYYLVEQQTADGYVLDPTQYEIELQTDKQQEEVIIVSKMLMNEREEQRITFDKTLEESDFLREDEVKDEIVFGLYQAKEQNGLPKDTLVDICEWRNRKEWYFENVLPGDYYIKELKTHPHYQLDDAIYEVHSPQIQLMSEDSFYNELKRGKIVLQKVDEQQKPLAGVTFLIASDEKMYDVLCIKTTDANGQIVLDDLEYGTYFIQEVDTLQEYVLDETVTPIVVNQTEPIVITKINYKKLGEISVKKVDDDALPLADAEFALYDLEGKKIQTAISDKQGLAVFSVPFGVYRLKETNAPKGYQPSKEMTTISVREEPVAIEVVNRKIPHQIDTGVKNGKEVLTYIFSGIWVVVLFLYRFRC
ncbi:MAG: SpaA isopeptide-forming pilin-related protein [Erysipelotrichaceae bacterium]|nr:SpaA isopeptide-forming pilin-related protein [Erysipelotrichaceae bacterium]